MGMVNWGDEEDGKVPITLSTEIPVPPARRPWSRQKVTPMLCQRCNTRMAVKDGDGYCLHCSCVYAAEQTIRVGERMVKEGTERLNRLKIDEESGVELF